MCTRLKRDSHNLRRKDYCDFLELPQTSITAMGRSRSNACNFVVVAGMLVLALQAGTADANVDPSRTTYSVGCYIDELCAQKCVITGNTEAIRREYGDAWAYGHCYDNKCVCCTEYDVCCEPMPM
jgi:hypothetical protein